MSSRRSWRIRSADAAQAQENEHRQRQENNGVDVEHVAHASMDDRMRRSADRRRLSPRKGAGSRPQDRAAAGPIQWPLPTGRRADQTLALETELFSKPQDVAGARAQLKRLRAKTHALHAARTPFRRPG